MEGPRSPYEEEYSKVLSFLHDSLRPNVKWSIEQEYPTALNVSNLNNIKVIMDDENVISHAVMKPLIVKTPLLLLKVAAIGSVVTADAYRQQGHSTKVLDDCLKSARDQGCDLAVLWTEIHDFYRKMGFELAGDEVRMSIHRPLKLESAPALRYIKGTQVDPEAIFQLYQQHRVSTLRTLPEIKKFMSIPNANFYSAWDEAGKLVAYAVEGKGADLKGFVHEWGGQVTPLINLFNHIYNDQLQTGTSITVLGPAHSTNLIEKMTEAGAVCTDGYLGMINILRPEQFCAKIKRVARYLNIDDLIFEKRDEFYYIGTPSKVFKTDSSADIIRLVFGPAKPTDLYAFDENALAVFEKIFPLQFWLWGWDSI
jgi:N-acetylglutamate synthase-like GNAT family acetyltransferase